MYLKSLEMVGFKSFAEARIEFPERRHGDRRSERERQE